MKIFPILIENLNLITMRIILIEYFIWRRKKIISLKYLSKKKEEKNLARQLRKKSNSKMESS